MKVCGHVFKYGDNVDTDVIIPARYLNATKGEELAKHCMEDIDREFVNKVQPGDIIVAEKNFGCGSSREHAPLAIKCAGVSCVIAETFARIFYRNSINIGLPIIECPQAAKAISAGDKVEVDFDSGVITNITRGEVYKGQSFPPFMQDIIQAGGLVAYINCKVAISFASLKNSCHFPGDPFIPVIDDLAPDLDVKVPGSKDTEAAFLYRLPDGKFREKGDP